MEKYIIPAIETIELQIEGTLCSSTSENVNCAATRLDGDYE